ncbi:MAG: long-chain fatty acid--CoA ligase [Bacteroidales bacterium]|jgi:long-chain acyl-CoA synthetase|nr:long-chain fatty acid--CoA ligase [Bacteroidales bacterium]
MIKPLRIFDILELVKTNTKPDVLAKRDGNNWIKYSNTEYYENSHYIAYALLELGYTQGDCIATSMFNRPEWNFLDMGIMLSGMVHVPVYPTLSESEYSFILNHCDCKALFVGVEQIYKRIIPAIAAMETKPDIFSIEPIDNVRTFASILELGKQTQEKWHATIEENKRSITPETLASIIYTSGTTGASKGVMLSHKNICSNFNPLIDIQDLTKEHKVLSFLPLCHMYERTVAYHYQCIGTGIYYAANLGSIAKDMRDCEADGFCAVPRIFEMMFDKLYAAGKDLSGIKKMIYFWAFRHACKFDYYNHKPLYLAITALADKLVYSKWRATLSGRPQMTVVSGGSAIQEKIIRLFTAAKIRVYEGYGLTETSPVIAVNNPITKCIRIGTVGEILKGIEFKLADDGEILTRGNCLMMGYYKDETYTREVIDSEGWFHTGDIGTLVDGRYLKITDRKKEIFKLSSGKYIAPQILENHLKGSAFIDNAMIVGENEKIAAAIIVPDFNTLHFWAAKHKIHYTDNADLVTNREVIKRVQKEINKINSLLADYEQIKKIKLIAEVWSTQTGELSQTLKLKRNVLRKKYDAVYNEFYGVKEEIKI